MDHPHVPDFGRRIRAARGYAHLTQPELAAQLQVSEGYLRQVESGKTLKPVQARGLAERIAEICDLPLGFFTADLQQLENEYYPPEAQLARLEATIGDLTARLDQLAAQADQQLAAGRAHLERFAQVIDHSRIGERLEAIEAKLG